MAPTSDEETKRQEAEAEKLVDESLDCAKISYHGEIPLRWKECPTEIDSYYTDFISSMKKEGENKDCNLDGSGWEEKEQKQEQEEEVEKRFCVSSRGQADISRLALLVEEGHDAPSILIPGKKKISTEIKSLTNLWDEVNAYKHNVHIVRPSHDSWGIKKITLIFCDDFLRRVYEMPWWHSRPHDIQPAVQPILDALGVPIHRVVRLILAALPPGVTIPVHHDSGEWVKHTHRVHVPIIATDHPRILFRCGPSEKTLSRVSAHPGHVFEMNNQAKHAVSNCSDKNRVHLILDYVDEGFEIRERIRCDAGERLHQTRRSIDRDKDRNKRQTPSYIIIGAQKAGTTSMYEYMNQHPLIVKAKRRETHNLDWRWIDQVNKKRLTTKQKQTFCLKFYHTEELASHPSCMTGDSTPSYLNHPDLVIDRLREVFPWNPKLIVMMRDPIKRAYSHYRMVTSEDGTEAQKKIRGVVWRGKSFPEVVRLEFKGMKDAGLIPYWREQEGVVDLNIFDDFAGSQKEEEAWTVYQKNMPMNSGSHSLLTRGMYELNLRRWLDAFPKEQFLFLKMEDMSHGGSSQKVFRKVLEFLDLPDFQLKDSSPQNSRDYDPMEQEMQAMLQRFYAPHNKRIQLLLGDEWREPWMS